MNFPQEAKTFLLAGPVGELEVMATWPSVEPQAVAIICHPHPLKQGTMHNKVVTILAKTFDKLGLATVRFNYRGVGRSEGGYGNMLGEIEDSLAIKEWVSRALPKKSLYLAGFSFGGFIAASVANQCDNVCQLITVAPAVNYADFNKLSNISCPWLVIQGDQDDIVPYADVLEFSRCPPSPLQLITVEKAGHFFHGQLMTLQKIVIQHNLPLFLSSS